MRARSPGALLEQPARRPAGGRQQAGTRLRPPPRSVVGVAACDPHRTGRFPVPGRAGLAVPAGARGSAGHGGGRLRAHHRPRRRRGCPRRYRHGHAGGGVALRRCGGGRRASRRLRGGGAAYHHRPALRPQRSGRPGGAPLRRLRSSPARSQDQAPGGVGAQRARCAVGQRQAAPRESRPGPPSPSPTSRCAWSAGLAPSASGAHRNAPDRATPGRSRRTAREISTPSPLPSPAPSPATRSRLPARNGRWPPLPWPVPPACLPASCSASRSSPSPSMPGANPAVRSSPTSSTATAIATHRYGSTANPGPPGQGGVCGADSWLFGPQWRARC